jgi:hypothetical protein
MNDYYYEIYNDDGGKEYYHNKVADRQIFSQKMDMAHRVWCQNNSVVSFIKNRGINLDAEIDMVEFMWVKLSAKPGNQWNI